MPTSFPPRSSSMIQVVDYEENFNNDMDTFLREGQIMTAGFDYHVVSILGAQSSGKSTLLNLLFGTQFRTMDEENGRYQVTQGVWLGLDSTSKIVVLDLEGTDSRERGEGAINFERKIALFALALSEVLIVNIWAQDVGRYNAANMDLLKTVMELDLQLFYGSSSEGSETPDNMASARMHKTRLLFVLRDHVSSPFEKLCDTLRADVEKIWTTIQKPEAAQGVPLTNFFDIDFFALPHKMLMEKQFIEQGAELRRRFLDDEVFCEEYQSGIAADGFPAYACNIWETIRANRELDIPSQKEMLAHVRCEEIGRDAIELFQKLVKEARNVLLPEDETLPIVFEDLLPLLKNATDTAIEKYRDAACRYSRSVAEAKEASIVSQISNDSKELLDAQLTVVSDAAANAARAALSARESGYAPWDGWMTARKTVLREVDNMFDATSGLGAVEELPEGHGLAFAKAAIATERRRVQTRVRDDVARFETDIQSRASLRIVDRFAKTIRGPVSNAVENTGKDVWQKVSAAVGTAWAAAVVSTRSAFGNAGMGLDEMDIEDIVEDRVKPACLERAETTIRDTIGSPQHVLMRMTKRFDDSFRFDERGVPRHFGPRDDIEAAFVAARDEAEALVDILGSLRLEGEVTNVRTRSRATGKAEDFEILNSVAREELRDKLKRQAGVVFMEVKRAQEAARITTKVPIWIVFLLLFLGWNEFVAVLRSPILLLLTVLVAPMIYIGYVVDAPTLLGPAVHATVGPYVEKAKAVIREMAAPSEQGNNTAPTAGVLGTSTSAPNSATGAAATPGAVPPVGGTMMSDTASFNTFETSSSTNTMVSEMSNVQTNPEMTNGDASKSKAE